MEKEKEDTKKSKDRFERMKRDVQQRMELEEKIRSQILSETKGRKRKHSSED